MQKKRVVYKRTKVMDFLHGKVDFNLYAGYGGRRLPAAAAA